MGRSKGSPAGSSKALTTSSKCSSSMSSFLAEAYICHCQVIINNPLAFKQIYQSKPNFKGPSVWPIFDSSFRWGAGNNSPNDLQLVNIEALKKKCSELKNKFTDENQYVKCRDTKTTSDPCLAKYSKQPEALTKRLCINYDDIPKKKRKICPQDNKKTPKEIAEAKEAEKHEKIRKSPSVQNGNCSMFKLSEDENSLIHCETFKIFTFQSEPFRLDYTCFRPREVEERLHYPNGDLAATFGIDGTGMIYYKNGELALYITEGKIGKRLTVMSKSGIDDEGVFRSTMPIGLFDTKGNGVVYGIKGNIRLNYDQAEGIVYDTPSGAPIRWQWKLYHFVMARREQLQAIQEDEMDEEIDPSDLPPPPNIKKHSSKKKKPKMATTSGKTMAHLTEEFAKMCKSPSKCKSLFSKNAAQCTPQNLGQTVVQNVKCPGLLPICLQSPEDECSRDDQTMETQKEVKKISPKSIQARLHKKEKKSPTSKSYFGDKVKSAKSECDQMNVESLLKQNSNIDYPTVAIEPRPIAMKLNENISLRILHQEHIHLDFRSFPIHLHLNIGVTLSPGMILRIDKVRTQKDNVPKVPCYFEHLYKRSLSLKNIHTRLTDARETAKEEDKIKEVKHAKLMGTFRNQEIK